MSAASDFARLQRLPPAEAMAFMDGRQLTADTYHWHDLWRDEHQRAFTVSRLARGDLLEALQASLPSRWRAICRAATGSRAPSSCSKTPAGGAPPR